MKAIPWEKLTRKWRSHTTLCTTPFTEQPGSNQNRKRSGRPRCTTEQEDKDKSSLRNRRLTSSQLAASLNRTRKTPVSMSTVKRRLRDAVLLGRVPLSSVCVLLPILIFSFYWPIWDMAFSLQLCLEYQHPPSLLFTVDVETGVLRLLFNVAASWGLEASSV